MKFIDLLRKLGIFRSGSASGTYTNAAERPTELMMDEVMDAKKDLTTKEDTKKIVGAVIASATGNPEKVTLGRKIFFWIMVVLAVLFLIGHISAGFSFSLVITLILWGGFLFFFLKKFAFQGAFSLWLSIVLSLVLIFITLMIFPGDSGNQSGSSDSGKSLGSYDKKVYDLVSEDGKFEGIAAIQTKENKNGKEYLSVAYHLKIRDNIPMNTSIACGGVPSVKGYNYAGNLLTPLSEKKNDPVGAFSQAYCNKDAWPQDLFGSAGKTYDCAKPVSVGTETDTFVPNFTKTFYSFEEFQSANTYEVYDGADAWVGNEKGDGCSLDDDLAVGKGKKIRAYTFNISERK